MSTLRHTRKLHNGFYCTVIMTGLRLYICTTSTICGNGKHIASRFHISTGSQEIKLSNVKENFCLKNNLQTFKVFLYVTQTNVLACRFYLKQLYSFRTTGYNRFQRKVSSSQQTRKIKPQLSFKNPSFFLFFYVEFKLNFLSYDHFNILLILLF